MTTATDTAGCEWGSPAKPRRRPDAGWVRCDRCGKRTHVEDFHPIFTRTCYCCLLNRLDKLIERAAARRGRRAAMRELKRLCK
jgi:hypothetical protein